MNILVYTDHFLTRSMTFINNQIINAQRENNIYISCIKRENEKLFPFKNVEIIDKSNKVNIYDFLRKFRIYYSFRDKNFENNLEKIICNNNIQLIHTHFGPSAVKVYPIAKKIGIPLLVTFHGYDASRNLRNSAYVRAIKTILSDDNVYAITVSNKMRENLISYGINGKNIITHYIGTDMEFFNIDNKIKSGEFMFLQVSNFVEKKGHAYTLHAFKKMLDELQGEKKEKVKLVLAGDGPLKPSMMNLSKQLMLDKFVTFTGPVDKYQVKELMSEADVFVHHSVTSKNGDQEGIPTVIMEAMSMGLPIISTFHAGIPELVRDGIDGILVKEKDCYEYSIAMLKLLNNKDKYTTGTRNWIAKEFNLYKNCQQLNCIYKNIVNRRKIR